MSVCMAFLNSETSCLYLRPLLGPCACVPLLQVFIVLRLFAFILALFWDPVLVYLTYKLSEI